MNSYYYTEPRRRVRRKKRRPVWPIFVLLLVLALCAYPVLGARMLTVDDHLLEVSGLSPNLKNLKIVYASDFHLSGEWSGSMAEKAISRINKLSADIVILGGDYGNTTEDSIRFFKSIPTLYARVGVYAVLGDRDYSNPDLVSELVGTISGRGIVPLVNAVAPVKVGQQYLYIAGADDFNESVPRVDSLAAQVKEEDFVIFAAHSPDTVKLMNEAKTASGGTRWYDLVLLGHTHGGQFNLVKHSLFSNLRLNEVSDRYSGGWVEENRASLLTSNGVGTVGLPIRLGAQPQVHRITLKSR